MTLKGMVPESHWPVQHQARMNRATHRRLHRRRRRRTRVADELCRVCCSRTKLALASSAACQLPQILK